MTLTQAGGFSGLLQHSVLQPQRLADDDAQRLLELLRDLQPYLAGETAQPEPAQPETALRDQRSYQLTLEQSGCAPARCTFDDASVPANVWPLLRFLKLHGTPG